MTFMGLFYGGNKNFDKTWTECTFQLIFTETIIFHDICVMKNFARSDIRCIYCSTFNSEDNLAILHHTFIIGGTRNWVMGDTTSVDQFFQRIRMMLFIKMLLRFLFSAAFSTKFMVTRIVIRILQSLTSTLIENWATRMR